MSIKRKSFIAILLAIVMIANIFPANAITPEAEDAKEQDIVSKTNNIAADVQEYTDNDTIGGVVEIASMREENVKHFRLSNGTYEAVSYTKPVHRKDSNGVWQDIDNRLFLMDVKGTKKYSTLDSRVIFADTFASGAKLFTLSESNYSVSMALINSAGSKSSSDSKLALSPAAPTIHNSARSSNLKFDTIEEATKIENRSSILYQDVATNTNIEYVLQGNDIKENIIVSAKNNEYIYHFQMELSGLEAELDDFGNIKLYDVESGKSKYIIPAPYMYDSAGDYSSDVSYELKFIKDGVYLLNVSANSDWINDSTRTFPITIDPSITLPEVIFDSYTYSSYPDENYWDEEKLWVSNSRTSYIYTEIPELPAGATFNNAYLYVSYYYYISSGSLLAGAYRVLEDWEDYSITYSNSPLLSSVQLDTAILSASSSITEATPGRAGFRITNAVNDWYEDSSTNFGIAIKREPSTTHTNSSVILKSSDALGDDYAYITVNYTYYVPDGVYAIQSDFSTTMWMTVENDSVWAGSHLQKVSSSSSPADTNVFDRSSLFKISRVSGTSRYIIRSMLNNNLSFGISGTEIITKEIPSADSAVALADTFYIEWDGYGFSIRPYGSSYVISMRYAPAGNLTTADKTNINSFDRWNLIQYIGTHRHRTFLYYPASWASVGHIVGTAGNATLVGSSTCIDANTLSMNVGTGYEELGELIWDSSNNKMTLFAYNPGKIIINNQIKYSDGSLAHTGTFSFRIVPQEGTYYIQNASTEKYIDIEGPSKASGAIIQQWNYHTGNQEKWIVEHVANSGGYIRLKSVYSNLYIGIDSSNTSSVKQYSTQNDYTLWKIDRTTAGNLVLKCKATESNGIVLSVPLTANSNGTDLTQLAYSDNNNYKDEWVLELVDTYKITFYGISNSGHDHLSCLENVTDNLHEDGFNNIALKTGAISSSYCLTDLKNSNVFTSRSHGHLVVWTGTATAASTGIVLNDQDGSEMIALYSHSWSNMTSGSTSIATTDSFVGLNMVLFIGCKTAYDGETGRNLPAVVSSQGAEVAIGFSKNINCSDANLWTEDFYSHLLDGHTVQESVDYASNNRSEASGLKSAVVCGNGNYRISE